MANTLMSVSPFLMANGQPIQCLPPATPMRHESIHQYNELRAMSRFKNVNHLMDNDIFEAFAWFLREICVQPDAASVRVAAPPFRLHLLYKDALHRYAHHGRPLRDKTR